MARVVAQLLLAERDDGILGRGNIVAVQGALLHDLECAFLSLFRDRIRLLDVLGYNGFQMRGIENDRRLFLAAGDGSAECSGLGVGLGHGADCTTCLRLWQVELTLRCAGADSGSKSPEI